MYTIHMSDTEESLTSEVGAILSKMRSLSGGPTDDNVSAMNNYLEELSGLKSRVESLPDE